MHLTKAAAGHSCYRYATCQAQHVSWRRCSLLMHSDVCVISQRWFCNCHAGLGRATWEANDGPRLMHPCGRDTPGQQAAADVCGPVVLPPHAAHVFSLGAS